MKILQTRGLGICQRPKGEKNTAGNHDLGWLTEISQRAETIQIISTTFAQCGNYFVTKVFSILRHLIPQIREQMSGPEIS